MCANKAWMCAKISLGDQYKIILTNSYSKTLKQSEKNMLNGQHKILATKNYNETDKQLKISINVSKSVSNDQYKFFTT